MKIQELERRTGLERATIRYYEREGLIRPERGENGYRNYTEADAAYLLKIRLLRQLGMSLHQISQLQAGHEDFSKVLQEQIQILGHQIQEKYRAQEVCRQMQSAGVSYGTLDASYYLRLFEALPAAGNTPQYPSAPFREPLPLEIHPWRRFFARSLDVALIHGLLRFFLIVVLRVRPTPWALLMIIASTALLVPIEALMLSKWGTTPGKWIFGIHLESREDRYLTYGEALARSWGVYATGMGYGIPFYNLFCHQLAYCALTGRTWRRFARYDEVNPPSDMSWDWDTEVTYSPMRGKWLALPLVLILTLNLVTGLDSVKPKYRGRELTVGEFAANYNAMLAVTDSGLDKLNQDGTVRYFDTNSVTVYINGTPEKEHAGFAYMVEDGHLTGLTYENSWRDPFHMNPVDERCFQAALSLLMAQEGFHLKELKEFETLWNENLREAEADFTYHGIRFRWSITFENCRFIDGMSIIGTVDDTQPSKVSLYFELNI